MMIIIMMVVMLLPLLLIINIIIVIIIIIIVIIIITVAQLDTVCGLSLSRACGTDTEVGGPASRLISGQLWTGSRR